MYSRSHLSSSLSSKSRLVLELVLALVLVVISDPSFEETVLAEDDTDADANEYAYLLFCVSHRSNAGVL